MNKRAEVIGMGMAAAGGGVGVLAGATDAYCPQFFECSDGGALRGNANEALEEYYGVAGDEGDKIVLAAIASMVDNKDVPGPDSFADALESGDMVARDEIRLPSEYNRMGRDASEALEELQEQGEAISEESAPYSEIEEALSVATAGAEGVTVGTGIFLAGHIAVVGIRRAWGRRRS